MSPDILRGEPSQGYNSSCVNKQSQSEQEFVSYACGQTDKQTDRQTDPNALRSHSPPGARVTNTQLLLSKASPVSQKQTHHVPVAIIYTVSVSTKQTHQPANSILRKALTSQQKFIQLVFFRIVNIRKRLFCMPRKSANI